MITPKQTINFDKELGDAYNAAYTFMTAGEVVECALNILTQHCHAASYNRGWWHDPITGLELIPGEMHEIHADLENFRAAWFPYVVATKIALIHSEVSEMLEAHRRDAVDDKIPFPGITAEAGDAVIRICDLLGMLNERNSISSGHPADYDLGLAILAKLPFNVSRPDHDLAKRAEPGQKKY